MRRAWSAHHLCERGSAILILMTFAGNYFGDLPPKKKIPWREPWGGPPNPGLLLQQVRAISSSSSSSSSRSSSMSSLSTLAPHVADVGIAKCRQILADIACRCDTEEAPTYPIYINYYRQVQISPNIRVP